MASLARTPSSSSACSQTTSRDGLVMFKLFLMRNVQFPIDDLRPYALVNFGGFTLRTGIATPIASCPDAFEFAGRELLFKVAKFSIYQGYPPLRLTFFNQRPDRPGADFLGALDIHISHRTAYTFNVRSMKVVHDDYEVFEVMFGFFPVVPEVLRNLDSTLAFSSKAEKSSSSSTSSSSSKGSTWLLGPLRKDKNKSQAKKDYELVRKFVEETLSPVEGLNNSSKSRLLQLLDLFKHQESRVLFYNELKYKTEGHTLSDSAFHSLLDVFRAVLREANNHHDFYTCKLFLDLSMSLYLSDLSNVECFLYTRVKNHEVFRNDQFWELTFLDVVASERLKLFEDTESASFGTTWHELTSDEQQVHTDKEQLMVVHLLCVFGWQMLNAGISAEDVCAFCAKMAKVHQLDDLTAAKLRQFVLIISVCGETAEGRQWTATPYVDVCLTKSASMDIVSCLAADESGMDSGACMYEEDPDINRRLENRDKWTHYQTLDGIDYYHNDGTNETRWSCPTALQTGEVPQDSPSTLEKSGFLVNGEIHVLTIYNVENVNVKPYRKGYLTLTNYRIAFFENSGEQTGTSKATTSTQTCKDLNELPVHSLLRIEVLKGEPCVLILLLKDMQQLRFSIRDSSSGNGRNKRVDQTLNHFCKLVHKYAWPQKTELLFAFFYKQSVSIADNGWNVYHADSEYRRQGAVSSAYWRKCTLNAEFEFSPTYPAVIYVPTGTRDDALARIKSFRSKGRVPALSYLCSSSGGAILRAAQPRVGITRTRCSDDEQLIRLAGVRYIIDARPKRNAVGNAAMGGGYEDTDNYQGCELLFMAIENIHVMRDSLKALVEHVSISASTDARDDYLTSLASNGWLRHVRQVLIAASKTAIKVCHEAVSCLVHCSDGWDRTSQITSLAMLMIDPYYRTMRGFAVLIEKEWLSFGHKFHQRHGHGDPNCNDPQRSPVFLQFLDCVWQMLQQFPVAFEFQESLLFCIATELVSCRFGTFLFNSERERVTARLKTTTVSLWTRINCERDAFLNPFFSASRTVLLPNCSMRCVGLFPYYCRMDHAFNIPTATEALSMRVREMFSDRRVQELERSLEREKSARALLEQREQQLRETVRLLQEERDAAQQKLPPELQEATTDWLRLLNSEAAASASAGGAGLGAAASCPTLDDHEAVVPAAPLLVLHTGTNGGPAPPPPPLPTDPYSHFEQPHPFDVNEYCLTDMGEAPPPPPPPPPPPEEEADSDDATDTSRPSKFLQRPQSIDTYSSTMYIGRREAGAS